MKTEGQRESTNVEYDCLGAKTKDYEQVSRCWQEVREFREAVREMAPESQRDVIDAYVEEKMGEFITSENAEDSLVTALAMSNPVNVAVDLMLNGFGLSQPDTADERLERFKQEAAPGIINTVRSALFDD